VTSAAAALTYLNILVQRSNVALRQIPSSSLLELVIVLVRSAFIHA